MQFVLTEKKKLYTWGASPQLIRLNNQARKRARMAQRFEETKTVLLNDSEVNLSTDNGDTVERVREENIKNITFGLEKVAIHEDLNSEIIPNDMNNKDLPTDSVVSVTDNNGKRSNYDSNGANGNDETGSNNASSSSATITGAIKNILPTQPKIEAKLKKLLKSKSGRNGPSVEEQLPDGTIENLNADSSRTGEEAFEEEYTEHLYPSLVDTSEVVGEIVQVGVMIKPFS